SVPEVPRCRARPGRPSVPEVPRCRARLGAPGRRIDDHERLGFCCGDTGRTRPVSPHPEERSRMRVSTKRLVLVCRAILVAGSSTLFVHYLGRGEAPPPAAHWVGTWAAAQHPAGTSGLSQTGFDNNTVRMTIHTSIGGEAGRLRLSNLYG